MTSRFVPGFAAGAVTSLALSLGPAAAQGLSRFAYALLLPSMRADLDWTLARAGGVASANAVGYLIGALLTSRLASRIGLRRTFAVGLIGTVICLAAPATASAYAAMLLIRLVAGIVAAFAFVGGGALAARIEHPPGSTSPMVVYFAGGGIGVALSGIGVPWLLGATDSDWRLGWWLLAAMALAFTLVAVRAAPHAAAVTSHTGHAGAPRISLKPAHLSYGLFGAGYVAYMTFVIALLDERGQSTAFQSLFWVVLGTVAAIGSFAWRWLPRPLQGKRELALTNALCCLGVLLILPSDHPLPALASAVVFGSSFLAVVGAVTGLGRSLLPPSAWTRMIGTLTGAFALGQCTGPIVTGALSDRPGGITAGLLLSATLLALAALTALVQPVTSASTPTGAQA